MSEFPASSCCIIDYLYLVEVNADSSLPILSEICQKFSMLIDEVLMRVCSRLCGICWLCLIAILKESSTVSSSDTCWDVELGALTELLRSKRRVVKDFK